jgi:hypothetical protein
MTPISSCMIPWPRQVKLLATRTAVPLFSVGVSSHSSACLVPPARFDRRAQAARVLLLGVSTGGLFGQPVTTFRGGDQSRTLSVAVDDPAAVAQTLHDQMAPADLRELIVILAEAIADVLRQRKQPQ